MTLVTGGDDQSVMVAVLKICKSESKLSASISARQVIGNAHASAIKVCSLALLMLIMTNFWRARFHDCCYGFHQEDRSLTCTVRMCTDRLRV